MNFFWGKKQQTDDGAYAPYEEIDAKRTSKLGYFFLVLMVIFGVWQGNNLLSSIQDTVDRPEGNSSCFGTMAQYAEEPVSSVGYYYSYESIDYRYGGGNDSYGQAQKPTCAFSKREVDAGLDAAYEKFRVLLERLSSTQTSLSSLESSRSTLQFERDRRVNDYQTSLIEDIAVSTTTGVFNSNQVGNSVTYYDSQLASLMRQINDTTRQEASLTSELKKLGMTYKGTIQMVENDYLVDMRMYKLKQFLLSAVLIFPLFVIAWRYYSRVRRNRSEYAIIWGGVVATFGLIVAQVLLVFLYEILPHEVIQALMQFFASFAILWTLLYWLGFILVPLFFGYLIYLIQKKFYNKRAVIRRAQKSGQCPQCSMRFHHSMNNCPVCGYELKSKCTACGGMSMSSGSFCEVCGTRREKGSGEV